MGKNDKIYTIKRISFQTDFQKSAVHIANVQGLHRLICKVVCWAMCATFLVGCTQKTAAENLIVPRSDGVLTGAEEQGLSNILESSAFQVDQMSKDSGASAYAGAFATNSSTGSFSDATDMKTILVHVCGAVVSEGVYELAWDSRISDAIDAAGGFLPEADTAYLNLAAVLSDGMQIRVPLTEEIARTSIAGTAIGGITQGSAYISAGSAAYGTIPADQASALININTATIAQLCSLSGIGEARAADIIAYRESNGSFKTTEELMNVSGIGEKMYNKIKDRITV